MKVAKIYLTVFSVISCEICTFWTFISDLHSLVNNFSCYRPLLFSCSIYFFFKRKKKNFRNFLLFESGFYRTLLGRLEVVQNRDEHALNFCRLL